MQSVFVRSICQMGVFIICAQVLVHFRPESSYEKYLKMLVGVMILLQVLQPFGSLLGGEQGKNLMGRVAWFEEQLNDSMAAARQSRERAEQMREQMSLEEVRRRLEEKAGEQGGEDAGEDAGKEGGEDAGAIAPVERIQIVVGEAEENDGRH